MKCKELKVTTKEKFLLDAIESGLIPETDNGYDTSAFERFWELSKQIINRQRRKALFFGSFFGSLFTRIINFLLDLL